MGRHDGEAKDVFNDTTEGKDSPTTAATAAVAAGPGWLKDWIKTTNFYAEGGAARGTDTVRAMLTPGEWGIPRAAVANIAKMMGGGFLLALNSMRMPAPPRPQYLASGGPVGEVSRSMSRGPGATLGGICIEKIEINTTERADDPA